MTRDEFIRDKQIRIAKLYTDAAVETARICAEYEGEEWLARIRVLHAVLAYQEGAIRAEAPPGSRALFTRTAGGPLVRVDEEG